MFYLPLQIQKYIFPTEVAFVKFSDFEVAQSNTKYNKTIPLSADILLWW